MGYRNIDRMEAEIEDLTAKIAVLKAALTEERRALKKVKRLKLDEVMQELLMIIILHPGIDREGIQSKIDISDNDYMLKMTALRRSRGLIVNVGNRKFPKYTVAPATTTEGE